MVCTFCITTFQIKTLIYVAAIISSSLSEDLEYSHEFNQTVRELEASDKSETDQKNECFSNRADALELGRQCSRRCRKDIPCENTRKQCLCDGLCGMSCIKPDLSCPDLRSIENGIIHGKNNRFNSRVTYQCNDGYYLFGSRERLCQGDEDWSGTPAVCMSERKYS